MPYPKELEYWTLELSSAFPNLSKPQIFVLALYSYGMAMIQHCGQTMVCVFLAKLLQVKSQNIRQRLKEFNYEAERKRGEKRVELALAEQFEPLLRWILSQWQEKKKLVLAVDVTYLRSRFTILTISLVYEGTAIPVAWKVLSGNVKGEWHPLWLELLAQIAPALPKKKQVLLLFDRGLYSKRLFEAVCAYGWHPFMRIREQGLYKRPQGKTWRDLKHLAKPGMKAYHFKVQCFKGDTLTAYLWLQWDEKHQEPCLLLSDLAPKQLKGNPYPLRMWIEASFKDWKRGGFGLEQSKTPDPQRLARLLFVMAIAFFYLLRFGELLLQQDQLLPSDPTRRLSLLTLGWIQLLVASIQNTSLETPYFRPFQLPHFYPPQNTYP